MEARTATINRIKARGAKVWATKPFCNRTKDCDNQTEQGCNQIAIGEIVFLNRADILVFLLCFALIFFLKNL